MFWSVNQSLLLALADTFKIFACTLIFAIPLGLVVAFGSMSKIKPLKYAVDLIVWVFRGTPLMLQLFVVFY
ncbi:MAG: ABC transporter permease subunit, partial [Peptococcaceae bacterium]|nr:ABC transporter permease subunit [Peptococcaceae bacterium]